MNIKEKTSEMQLDSNKFNLRKRQKKRKEKKPVDATKWQLWRHDKDTKDKSDNKKKHVIVRVVECARLCLCVCMQELVYLCASIFVVVVENKFIYRREYNLYHLFWWYRDFWGSAMEYVLSILSLSLKYF